MKKKYFLSGLFLTTCMLMTACSSDPNLNLTKEQEAQIVEYAANIVIKYDKAFPKRLEEIKPDKKKAVSSPNSDTEDIGVETEKEPAVAYTTMEQAVNLQNLSVAYFGYDLYDEYPETSESANVVSLTPRDGNKLVVLKFQMDNLSDSTAICNLPGSTTKVRFRVNGDKEYLGLPTLLDNDIYTYAMEIPAQGSQNAVAVIEMGADEAANIQNMIMVLTVGEQVYEVQLQ